MKLGSKILAQRQAILLASACGCLLALSASAGAATVVSFDVPTAVATMGQAIDFGGDITGVWYDSGEIAHGFLRTAGGTITPFDPAGSTGTNVYAMNDAQTVVGSFSDSGGTHGFLRTADGTITVYDAPGSVGYTEIYSINNSNAYAGTYAASDGNDYGFIVYKDGTFKSFSANGARYTSANAINDKSVIAGETTDSGTFHAFVRTSKGVVTSFDVPGGDEPLISGINAQGSVAGTSYEYPDSNSGQGFIRLSNGTFQTFQVDSGYETDLGGINVHNVVCGDYYDASGHYHGYIRFANGSITSFDHGNGGATACRAINDTAQTTGYYYDKHNIGHGFLRTP
jgi:hypothetical protein